MPAARRNAITELFFRIHPWIYRKTGGRILGRFGGPPAAPDHAGTQERRAAHEPQGPHRSTRAASRSGGVIRCSTIRR
jgi:hypothetical protein